jgi:DNA-binding transcriptional MerR regulator
MLLGELRKKTKCTRQSLDRYAQLGLIPFTENDHGYRIFNKEAIDRVDLIRALTKRPFKRDLKEIKEIFEKVSIAQLVERKKDSNKKLLHFLNEHDLL